MPQCAPKICQGVPKEPQDILTSSQASVNEPKGVREPPDTPSPSQAVAGHPHVSRPGPTQKNPGMCNPKYRTVMVTSWPRWIREVHYFCSVLVRL